MEVEGEKEFTLEELEALLNDDSSDSQPNNTDNASSQTQGVNKEHVTLDNMETHEVFSQRLKAHAAKEVAAERERIAKELGYESYEAMQQGKEKKILEDSGLDAEEVTPVVNKIVEERLKNDPRMKELDDYRNQKLQEFAKKELEEIKTLTNGEISSLEQLPADVLDDWKKSGSLKKSYISLHAEELIIKARKSAPKGTTTHLQSASGVPPQPTNARPLTNKEKDVWRLFKPGITEEELNQKTIKGD